MYFNNNNLLSLCTYSYSYIEDNDSIYQLHGHKINVCLYKILVNHSINIVCTILSAIIQLISQFLKNITCRKIIIIL